MKRFIALVIVILICLGLSACASSTESTNTANVIETPTVSESPKVENESITGNKYLCTLVEITDEDYDEFDVADSVHRKLFNSSIVISNDHTKMVYTNELGVYVADIKAVYDGEMWYESEVTWQETPTPYGEHTVTATTLLFDEARGLVRMNFSLDGEIGDEWSGVYFIFNEFELE